MVSTSNSNSCEQLSLRSPLPCPLSFHLAALGRVADRQSRRGPQFDRDHWWSARAATAQASPSLAAFVRSTIIMRPIRRMHPGCET